MRMGENGDKIGRSERFFRIVGLGKLASYAGPLPLTGSLPQQYQAPGNLEGRLDARQQGISGNYSGHYSQPSSKGLAGTTVGTNPSPPGKGLAATIVGVSFCSPYQKIVGTIVGVSFCASDQKIVGTIRLPSFCASYQKLRRPSKPAYFLCGVAQNSSNYSGHYFCANIMPIPGPRYPVPGTPSEGGRYHQIEGHPDRGVFPYPLVGGRLGSQNPSNYHAKQSRSSGIDGKGCTICAVELNGCIDGNGCRVAGLTVVGVVVSFRAG